MGEEIMSTSKVRLKNKMNGRIVHVLKHVNKFGHVSYFLIPRFCTYCGHEGLVEVECHSQGLTLNRCPACGLKQMDEVRPHIDIDEWEEVVPDE
jgi:predicted Zn-ribbon and HTH transcriptional regulator